MHRTLWQCTEVAFYSFRLGAPNAIIFEQLFVSDLQRWQCRMRTRLRTEL